MPQQDMAWETFCSIVDSILEPGSTVSLQGEGEPTLHPKFWQMTLHTIKKGHHPYTITNGSRVDAARFAKWFPRVAVSVDTLDEEVAKSIGRHNLHKTLASVMELKANMGAPRVEIMTVDFGQDLGPLRVWAQAHGFARHIVQSLMKKQDYVRHYPAGFGATGETSVAASAPSRILQPMACRFLEQRQTRYFNWQGQEFPCCFMKDTEGYQSVQWLRRELAQGRMFRGCEGCAEATPLNA